MEELYELPPMDDELRALLEEPVEPESDEAFGMGSVVRATVKTIDRGSLRLAFDGGEVVVSKGDVALPGIELDTSEGTEHTVLLDAQNDDESWRGSIGKGYYLDLRDAWRERARNKERVRGRIRYVARGGFIVEVEGMRCFLPGRDSGIRFDIAFAAVGEALDCTVVRWDGKHDQPVLSRRDLIREEQATRLAELQKLAGTDTRIKGHVVSLKPFGAFVDVGGIDGLLHVSEISLQPIDHPSEVLSIGDEVEVTVTEVDSHRQRVGLSRRSELTEAIGAEIEALELGAVVEGKVTRLAEFGAFIELADGLEGLCHISEISWTERPNHPSELLAEGQDVTVKIIEVQPERRRVGLSIKQLDSDPWQAFAEANPAGTVVEGELTRIEPYGLFISVTEGIEGLCHISELTWTGRPEHPTDVDAYEVGQSISAKVLEIDTERRRLALGIRQLTSDPWDDAGDKTTVGAVFTARVTRFDDNVAWVEVVEGLEGRLHISQISTERIDSIRSALRIDQEIEVMTTSAERSRRRLDVSIRAIEEKARAEMPTEYQDDDAGMNPMAAAFAASGLAASEDNDSNALTSHEPASQEATEPESDA